jgi:hypothetical protein
MLLLILVSKTVAIWTFLMYLSNQITLQQNNFKTLLPSSNQTLDLLLNSSKGKTHLNSLRQLTHNKSSSSMHQWEFPNKTIITWWEQQEMAVAAQSPKTPQETVVIRHLFLHSGSDD